jgi:hypothetical protein
MLLIGQDAQHQMVRQSDELVVIKDAVAIGLPASFWGTPPKELLTIAGRRVRICGQMFPPCRETGLNAFVISPLTSGPRYSIYSRQDINGFIDVVLREGLTVDWNPHVSTFEVEGRVEITYEMYKGKREWYVEIHDATARRVAQSNLRSILYYPICDGALGRFRASNSTCVLIQGMDSAISVASSRLAMISDVSCR